MKKEEAKKIFGENLKRIRIAKGITQEELAKALGYANRSSINKIEIGRSDMPRSKIEEAANFLGVSPLELFKNEPVAEPDIAADDILFSYTKLSDTNKIRLKAYLSALLDSQEGKE